MDILTKLRYCSCPDHLLRLESAFNEVGCTIQTSAAGKVYLCKIKDNKPSHEALFVDHIPIKENLDLDAIESFILENGGAPSHIVTDDVVGPKLYGDSFTNPLQERLKSELRSWLMDD